MLAWKKRSKKYSDSWVIRKYKIKLNKNVDMLIITVNIKELNLSVAIQIFTFFNSPAVF